jgi:hypothetical protein
MTEIVLSVKLTTHGVRVGIDCRRSRLIANLDGLDDGPLLEVEHRRGVVTALGTKAVSTPILSGASPTSIVAVNFPDSASITETELSVALATKTVRVLESTSMLSGPLPTLIAPVIEPDAMSRTVTEFPLVTYAVCVVGSTPTNPGALHLDRGRARFGVNDIERVVAAAGHVRLVRRSV